MNDILSPESYTYLFNLIIEYSPKILLGLIFLFVGNRAIKRVINILEKFLNNKKLYFLKLGLIFVGSVLIHLSKYHFFLEMWSLWGLSLSNFVSLP